jgi:transcriptional regulator with XRE-family HTH domain
VKLSKHLKQLLDDHGFTVSMLSRQTKVPKQTITDWLAGTEPRKLTQIKAVADALGVSIDTLVFGPVPENRLVPAVLETSKDGWLRFVGEVQIRPLKQP